MPFYYVSVEKLTGSGPFVDVGALMEGMEDDQIDMDASEEAGVVLFINDDGVISLIEDSWDFIEENS